jgi:hypothetical protein
MTVGVQVDVWLMPIAVGVQTMETEVMVGPVVPPEEPPLPQPTTAERDETARTAT